MRVVFSVLDYGDDTFKVAPFPGGSVEIVSGGDSLVLSGSVSTRLKIVTALLESCLRDSEAETKNAVDAALNELSGDQAAHEMGPQ